jgi:hypothetical protein
MAKSVASLELTGLEKLSRQQMDNFRGRVLDLGERRVKAGAARLAVNVILPAGYKFNLEAPFFMRLKFGPKPEKVDVKRGSFPLDVPIDLPSGRSEVTLDTIVYYCTAPSSACYVDPIRVKLALAASASAPASLPVDIPVRKP